MGDLPDYLIKAVKDRIYESEKFWQNCSTGNSKANNWYHWNIYMEFIFGNCKLEKMNLIHESYHSVDKLFSPKTLQITIPEGKLIKPLLLSGSQ